MAEASTDTNNDADSNVDQSLTERQRPADSLNSIQKTFLKRRDTKNAKSRARAATLKHRIVEIRSKPKQQWTTEEQNIIEREETRRRVKNDRSRERALEKKEEIQRILAIPVEERTQQETEFLHGALQAKTRKNIGDRRRRQLLKNLGIPEKVGLKRALVQQGKMPPASNRDITKVIADPKETFSVTIPPPPVTTSKSMAVPHQHMPPYHHVPPPEAASGPYPFYPYPYHGGYIVPPGIPPPACGHYPPPQYTGSGSPAPLFVSEDPRAPMESVRRIVTPKEGDNSQQPESMPSEVVIPEGQENVTIVNV